MNIRRALIGMLSAVVAAALLLGVTFLDVNLTSDVEPDLSYRTLDYDVMVLKNGDLKVTQHIDMKLNDRGFDWKQMYQQYTLKANNLTNISDISVKDVTNNETYIQGRFVNPNDVTDWNAEHAGQWYIADVSVLRDPQPFNPETDGLKADSSSDKTLEIGWNIPETASADSLKFDVSMTMHGVSTAYDDVVSFQWGAIRHDKPDSDWQGDRQGHVPRRRHQEEFLGMAAYQEHVHRETRQERVAALLGR